MENITKYSYAMYTNTKELARLRVGWLLKDMMERFKQKIELTLIPKERRLWLYTAHDYTIANILNGLGVFEVGIGLSHFDQISNFTSFFPSQNS